MSRLWDKGAPLDAKVLAYTAGEDHVLDNRLVAYDVRASIAHAQALNSAKLIRDEDCARLCDALTQIGAEHARGEWTVTLAEEDSQTALEQRLTARLGETGGRIHLGRSRNDQVLVALRLYLRDAVNAIAALADEAAATLHTLAAAQGAIALPGYTHMQQAMPSSVALWAHGYAAELADDAAGLRLTERRHGRTPLGSAAGYGTPGLALDRATTTALLEFQSTHEPVTAVQLSRGKAEAHVLFELTLLMTDLGRLAADVLLFYTQEFAFVDLPEAFTTGSSIMPQKRNPDVFELIRGRSATAGACLSEVLGIFAKLPSGYQRDLQLIKAPLFRGIDLATQTLSIMPDALAGLRFRPENIHLDPSIHAAEEANRLAVAEGIPFREAYRRVGRRLREG